MMRPSAAVFEMDTERDRKTCVALDLKVDGANRELAQWLADHPRYSLKTVAGWLSCGKTRIGDLRQWAQSGFSKDKHPTATRMLRFRNSGNETLKSQDNLDDSEEVADAATVEDNALHALARMNEHARIFKKFFKLSTFDAEAKIRISNAIDRMIGKWRSTQATLKRRHNG